MQDTFPSISPFKNTHMPMCLKHHWVHFKNIMILLYFTNSWRFYELWNEILKYTWSKTAQILQLYFLLPGFNQVESSSKFPPPPNRNSQDKPQVSSSKQQPWTGSPVSCPTPGAGLPARASTLHAWLRERGKRSLQRTRARGPPLPLLQALTSLLFLSLNEIPRPFLFICTEGCLT